LTERLICELTAAELCEVDVGRWFADRPQTAARSFAGEKLPTLAQVFDLFSANTSVLYVEMKCDVEEGAALAAAVTNGIEKFRMANRVVVASFDLDAIAEIKRIDAGIRTAALFEPRISRPISTVRRLKMVDLALDVGAEEIALHHTLARGRVIQKAKREELEIVVWTVDDPEWIARASGLGIKALIANDPGMMVRHRNAASLEFKL